MLNEIFLFILDMQLYAYYFNRYLSLDMESVVANLDLNFIQLYAVEFIVVNLFRFV